MNEKSLEKNLSNLERELVNLQTARDVGLGGVSFYTYTAHFWTFHLEEGDWPMTFVLIDVLDGEQADPLMNVYISSIFGTNDSGYANIERVNSRKFDLFVQRPFYTQDIQMEYIVVSSSKLRVKAAESYQEYVDWLNE